MLLSAMNTCLCSLLRRFATLENSGLLFYNGRFNEKHDFIALEIQEGQVVLKYSTGRRSVSPTTTPTTNITSYVHDVNAVAVPLTVRPRGYR